MVAAFIEDVEARLEEPELPAVSSKALHPWVADAATPAI